MAYKPQRIRDPLHNLIQFDADQFDNALWSAIQTKPFQRLRRVKQLGFSELVYPGATHSRYAHSVGVFHTARRLLDALEAKLPPSERKESRRHIALGAALLHDVGHGPFSHAFESVGEKLGGDFALMTNHEQISEKLIRQGEISEVLTENFQKGFAEEVADMIGGGPKDLYSAIVSSQFDADRLDYMRRDRLMTGTQHAAIDFEWLIANLEVGEVQTGVDEQKLNLIQTLVLGPKAIHAAEGYILGLFQLYPTVYFHKSTRGAEKIFTELLFHVISQIRDGSIDQTALSENHPIARFAKDPTTIQHVLNMDDSVVCGALAMMSEAKNPVIAQFADRLQSRKLYKCFDIWKTIDPDNTNSSETDKSCVSILQKIEDWKTSKDTRSHRILIDKAYRESYKSSKASKKGPLNQIRIKTTNNGELADIESRSPVVNAIGTFNLCRAYVAEDDSEARKFIETLAKGEIDERAKAA